MSDSKKMSLSGAMALVQQKLKGNDNCSAAGAFTQSAVAPDLAAVARMHNMERRAEQSGHFIPAPPTRH